MMPESCLAAMDSGRTSRRRVYRDRDDQPDPSAAPSRRRIISAHRPWEKPHMDIVIGPVLKRPGGYGFNVWTAARGLTRGYPYHRVEDAYYAWRAGIRASAQCRVPAAMVCQTLDEFIVKSTGCETLAAA